MLQTLKGQIACDMLYAACSSSFVALHDAVVDLQRGRIDYAMVGGASKYLNLSSTAAFNEPRCGSLPMTCSYQKALRS